MKFTERELYLLSDGILRLVGQVNDAAIALSPSSPSNLKTALEEYRRELMALNSKICSAMDDAEKEAEQPEQKTVVKIVCENGEVQSVYRNRDGAEVEAIVLDMECSEAEEILNRDIVNADAVLIPI